MTDNVAQVRELEEAVGLARQLADDPDAGSLARLAQALQSLAEVHIGLEQAEAAHPLLQEAQQAGERLNRLEPAAALVLDGKTSRLFASMYLSRGDHQNAIAYGQDAETRLREAVRKDRGAEPELADALRSLALSLDADDFSEDSAVPDSADMSMEELARTVAARAVEGAAARAEAAGHGDVELQLKLDNKHVAARKKDAQRKIDEAFEIYRRLSKRQPELYLAEQARTAERQADILMGRGKYIRAAMASETAVDLYAKAVQYDQSLQDSYLAAADAAVTANIAAGSEARARKLSQRYGVEI